MKIGSKSLRRGAQGTLAVSMAAAVMVAAALPAAAQSGDPCVPKDAWTETIPAVGEPTILVKVTEGTPATEPRYRIVHHPAETTTTTEYQRYSWNPKGQVPEDQTPDVTGSTPLNEPDSWQANTTNYENGHSDDPVNVAFYVSNPNGQGNGSWFYWTAEEKTVVVKEAWDEKVLCKDGTPGTDDVWVEEPNPDYVPAKVVPHDAVTCPATTEAPPKGLAATGSNAGILALVAAGLTLAGVGAFVARRRLTNR